MKILFVTPYYKPYLGGIERVIEKLTREFIKMGNEVYVLTSKYEFPNSPGQKRIYHEDWKEQEVLESGEQIYRLHSFPRTAPSFYQAPLVWFSPWDIKHIVQEIQPDEVLLMGDRWFWGNFWVTVFSGTARKAFAVIFHELDKGKDNRLLPWVLKQLLRPINAIISRMVDWVHVVTSIESEMVQRAYAIPESKIRIIPWGVDFSRSEISQDRTTNGDSMRILAVGRISEHKGQDWLADVTHEVAKIFNKKITLVLVGKDDGFGNTIQDKFVDEELLEVEFTGAISDEALRSEYMHADIFALFPEYESFGLVYIEAMSYGIPVVTHDVGAVREVLGEYAMITDKYNAAQAKVVLSKLVEDEAFRKELGTNGNKYVREAFSWGNTAHMFLGDPV